MVKLSLYEWQKMADSFFPSFGNFNPLIIRENVVSPVALTNCFSESYINRYFGDITINLQPQTGGVNSKVQFFQYDGITLVKFLELTNTSLTDYKQYTFKNIQFQQVKALYASCQFVGYNYTST
jgi:hypothetical protein